MPQPQHQSQRRDLAALARLPGGTEVPEDRRGLPTVTDKGWEAITGKPHGGTEVG